MGASHRYNERGRESAREPLAVPVAALELDNYDRLLVVFSAAQTPWVLLYEPGSPAYLLILEPPATFYSHVSSSLLLCW